MLLIAPLIALAIISLLIYFITKLSRMHAMIAYTILIIATSGASLAAGFKAHEMHLIQVANEEARWIARYHNEATSIKAIISRINTEQNMKIISESWIPGSHGTIAIGPIINGRQILILESGAILWQTLTPPTAA